MARKAWYDPSPGDRLKIGEVAPPGAVVDTAAALADVNPVLLLDQLAVEKDTGKQKVGDGATAYADLDYLPSQGGDTSALLPIADPTGVTTETMANPAGGPDINVLTFPADTPAFAVKVAGDDFPRWLLFADAAGNGLYLGDGTYDAFAGEGTEISGGSGGQLSLWAYGGIVEIGSPNGIHLRVGSHTATFGADGGFSGVHGLAAFPGGVSAGGIDVSGDAIFDEPGTGPVVVDSDDGHTYRLGTTNGVVTATQVT